MAQRHGCQDTPGVARRGRTRRDDREGRRGTRPGLPGRWSGRPEPGDEVLLNTTALAMGLGTGGYAMVVAVPDRFPADPAGPGHLVKARYTPLQATVLGADEQDSAHHEVLRDADSIGGMPVVVADLHSALPAIVAGLHLDRPRHARRVRHAGRRGAAGLVLPVGGGAARGRLAGRRGHRRAGVRRRPGGGDPAHRAARRTARARTRRSRSSPRGRATSAPAHAGGSRACRRARR